SQGRARATRAGALDDERGAGPGSPAGVEAREETRGRDPRAAQEQPAELAPRGRAGSAEAAPTPQEPAPPRGPRPATTDAPGDALSEPLEVDPRITHRSLVRADSAVGGAQEKHRSARLLRHRHQTPVVLEHANAVRILTYGRCIFAGLVEHEL